ncbi:Hypothetical predicted protein [Cloeon dipterum]|uniref:PH domain-containing protein n=1 Tax=Cloeon dipterum TaxID=197152 RepID=A0A8S1D9L9_9INSE|nr:Hypothetical predicted protein [Cloeon dipterum]
MAADVNNIEMLLQSMVVSKDESNDLVWCPDAQFETTVYSLDSSALLNLVQRIQEAMGREQVLFDAINKQLALTTKDSLNHKNLSTALCASQARLARLCARNMRCFMQAMSSQKPKDSSESSAEAAAPAGANSGKLQPVPQKQQSQNQVGSLAAVASSVDGLISSVKRLQTNHTAMVKSAFKQPSRPASLNSSAGNSSSGDDSDSPLYENVLDAANVYENVASSPPQHIYDQPKINPKSVVAFDVDDEAIYENVDFEKASTSSGVSDEAFYENVGSQNKGEEVTYDVPWNSQPIYANPDLAAKKARKQQAVTAESVTEQLKKDVDQDSLEDLDEPDIPSPDYGSDEDFQSGDFDLSGFSDPPQVDFHHFSSANGNYYNEDQGLAVILEESEEEEEEEDEDCLSTLSTASAESASRPSTPHEVSKLDASEDTPDGELPRPKAIPKIFIAPRKEEPVAVAAAATAAPTPAPEEPVTKKIVEEVKVSEAKIIAEPQLVKSSVSVAAAQTNETEAKEEAKKEPEFQLPSVKNLRSHFEAGGNKSSQINKEPAFVPRKFTSNLFKAKPQPLENNNVSSLNNNIVDAEPVKLVEKEPAVELPVVEEVRTASLVKQVSFSEASNADDEEDEEEYVEPIMKQFSEDYDEEEILKPRPTTRSWDPAVVLKELYTLPEPLKQAGSATASVTIEGFLEKLPSGIKKSTYWNAWKRLYFRAKDGVLYCYRNDQTEEVKLSLQLMGGKVESLETSSSEDEQHPMVSKMLGIDDGKGHYVVVRCKNKQEKERWRLALNTHTTENFTSTYVNPWPLTRDPALLKSTIIIDLGSSSTRAGILCSQATLPQIFFPTIMAVDKITKKRTFGLDALKPEVRSTSSLHFPVKPSAKITKYSVDVNAIPGLFEKVFDDLNVDQRMYDVILSVPRSFNTKTQTEIVNILFDKFDVNAVNMTHQSVLALYSYNATSGVVVDIGERMDIVPINEGYIVENGVSRIPYGGSQIVDHLRHFLHQKQYSLVTEVESFLIRYVLENLCYSAQHYNTEMQKFREDATAVEQSVSIKQFFDDTNVHWESITLDSGRFQSTEGLFNPDAWGLDNLGVHKLVHKAIRECSMDVRKEMTRSIYLSGGVTMLPGFAERLHAEVDKVTPKSLQPKVHASPYRYHASFIGACVLANSPEVDRLKISKCEWQSSGTKSLSKWNFNKLLDPSKKSKENNSSRPYLCTTMAKLLVLLMILKGLLEGASIEFGNPTKSKLATATWRKRRGISIRLLPVQYNKQ